MKKTLVIIGLSIVLFSCSKGTNKRCWECKMKYVGYPVEDVTASECDKTRSEIDDEIKNRYKMNLNDSSRFFMECH